MGWDGIGEGEDVSMGEAVEGRGGGRGNTELLRLLM